MSESKVMKTFKNIIVPMFEEGRYEEAKDTLRKVALRLTKDDSTEDKRVIYRNLAWVYDEIGDSFMAKKSITYIKNIVDNDKKYKLNNIGFVVDIDSLYTEIMKNEVTKEERLEINRVAYEYYSMRDKDLDKRFVAESNIAMLEGRYDDMVNILGIIHNLRYCGMEESMLKRLINVEKEIMKDLKSVCPSVYNEVLDTLINYDNTLVI